MDKIFKFDLQLFADEGGNENLDNDNVNNNPNEGKTFTQEDLNRIIAKNLKTEKAKWEKEAAEKLAEADKTEMQKLQDKINTANREKDEIMAAANKRLIIADIKEKGISVGIPTDRIGALIKLVDISTVEVDENGLSVGSKEAVEQAINEYPFLIGEGYKKAIGSASNNGEKITIEKTMDDILRGKY